MVNICYSEVMQHVVLLDCQDSFTYLLADRLRRLRGIHTTIIPEKQAPGVLPSDVSVLILSPGPGLPQEHPAAFRLLSSCPASVTVLGICLGHQVIGMHYGARLIHLSEPRHGCCKRIHYIDGAQPCGCPPEMDVGLYHSWALDPTDSLEQFEYIAWDQEGIPMALRHRCLPRYGLQFHPESVLSAAGDLLLACLLR